MFKPVFIEATTIDDCWHQLLWAAKHKGREYLITSGSYEGQKRLALDFASGFIHHPHTRPLAPRMPESSPLPPPTTDHEIHTYFVYYLMDPNLEKYEHYRYSSWIVGGNRLCDVNQIDWVINHLKKSPGNEHCYVTVGTPEWLLNYDKPYKHCVGCDKWFGKDFLSCPHCGGALEHHEHKRRTTPCLRGLDFRIIDNYLELSVVYRSWDMLSGFPTNMGGFTLLNEYVAQEIGCDPGPLAFSCKSLHIYEHGWDYLNSRFCGGGEE